MRRTHDLITEFQCPNWDIEGDLSAQEGAFSREDGLKKGARSRCRGLKAVLQEIRVNRTAFLRKVAAI
jgi:hypothetical protein